MNYRITIYKCQSEATADSNGLLSIPRCIIWILLPFFISGQLDSLVMFAFHFWHAATAIFESALGSR